MPAPSPTRTTTRTFCRICESLCGLEVEADRAAGRIDAIHPDEQHLATEGFACVKGLKQMRLYQSPDRLTRPLKRVGDRFEEISWQQAFAEIGEKTRALRDVSRHSLSMYVGTAAGFGVLHPVFAKGFMDGIGTRNFFGSSTQDCANKFAVSTHLYGFPFTLTYPDLRRTRCLIIVGANPVVSKWSFLQVPNPAKQLRAIEARGGRVFVVDPRRTETAKSAGEHVSIRPNADVFFYLAFLQELLATATIDRERIDRFMSGFDEIVRLAQPWTPERQEEVTRIPAAKLREMVAAYREADGAALYCSTGVNMGRHGTLAFWIQEVINAVSGNLDRPGGTLVGKGILDFPKLTKSNLMKSHVSRVGGFTAVNDCFPGAILADEILTEGSDRVRALFVTGGNPLITMAGAGRLSEALSKLELLVVTDIFLNETASLADYVLPATTPFERPDLPFVFPLMLGLQTKPYLQATDKVLEPHGEALDEATVYVELAHAAGVSLFGSRLAQGAMRVLQRLFGQKRASGVREVPQRLLLSLLLLLTGNGTFARLLKEPHGRPRPAHDGGDFLGQRILTEDGRLHLAPKVLLDRARDPEAGLEAAFEAERSAAGELRLIGRRHVKTHNSWTHNDEAFAKEGETNFLFMHPDDAGRVGVKTGDHADVRSATALIRLPVKLLPDLSPGTVAVPHGWGHQHARGLSRACRTAGVNVNLLAADGPDAVDPISGMAHLTGIPVEVRPAEGAPDPGSWSGVR